MTNYEKAKKEEISENALGLMSSYVNYICRMIDIEPQYKFATKYDDCWEKK